MNCGRLMIDTKDIVALRDRKVDLILRRSLWLMSRTLSSICNVPRWQLWVLCKRFAGIASVELRKGLRTAKSVSGWGRVNEILCAWNAIKVNCASVENCNWQPPPDEDSPEP